MKRDKGKLSIRRQTVRLLGDQLAEVVGGDTTRPPTWRDTCESGRPRCKTSLVCD